MPKHPADIFETNGNHLSTKGANQRSNQKRRNFGNSQKHISSSEKMLENLCFIEQEIVAIIREYFISFRQAILGNERTFPLACKTADRQTSEQ